MKLEFLNKDGKWKKSCDSDGTKVCFVFLKCDLIDEFVSQLEKNLKISTSLYFYSGGKAIYVPISKYNEVIQLGMDIINKDDKYIKEDIYWLDCYDEVRNLYEIQVLQAEIMEKYKKEDGNLKERAKVLLRNWIDIFQQYLGIKVECRFYSGFACFFINRDDISYKDYRHILYRIRNNSKIIEKGPFSSYALLDYYGEFVKL